MEGWGSELVALVHVADDALDGDVSDGVAEEELLDGVRGDGAEGRQEEQQLAEAEGLCRVLGRDVLAQRQLRVVLERRHCRHVPHRAPRRLRVAAAVVAVAVHR